MEIEILSNVPEEWKTKKGRTYETKYLYTGLSRYDTERKMYTRIEMKEGGRFLYSEITSTDTCFSRGYHTELVRVTLYADSPRIWKEELSTEEVYFFREIPQQTD